MKHFHLCLARGQWEDSDFLILVSFLQPSHFAPSLQSKYAQLYTRRKHYRNQIQSLLILGGAEKRVWLWCTTKHSINVLCTIKHSINPSNNSRISTSVLNQFLLILINNKKKNQIIKMLEAFQVSPHGVWKQNLLADWLKSLWFQRCANGCERNAWNKSLLEKLWTIKSLCFPVNCAYAHKRSSIMWI